MENLHGDYGANRLRTAAGLEETEQKNASSETKPLSRLSDYELAQAMLRGMEETESGIPPESLLALLDLAPLNSEFEKLSTLIGIEPARALSIAAALEFSRRRFHPQGLKIREPKDFMPLVQRYAERTQEHFITATLNGAHEVIKSRVVTIGLANSALVHPREVFADAIADRAVAIIAAHNHPSGDLEPSAEDKSVTKRLKAAGEIIGIKVLDHIIFSKRGFCSLKEAGEI